MGMRHSCHAGFDLRNFFGLSGRSNGNVWQNAAQVAEPRYSGNADRKLSMASVA